jgi:hypothetical protein
MGTSAGRSDQQEKSLTAEEATRRLDALRHIYREGYITRTTFETLVRNTRAGVEGSSDPAGHRRSDAP